MAEVTIQSAFVEEQVGDPVFVLKCAEPHSKKDEQGKYQTESRTFFDLKVSRDSGIDLNQFQKGARVKVWGNQKTEVREHEGKKFYSLVVWADRIEVAQAAGGGNGGGSGGPGDQWAQPAANGAQEGAQGFPDPGGFVPDGFNETF